MATPYPCFSVIMPVFNEERTLLAIVKRVLDSPYVAELIIVDDGSSDRTREMLDSISDNRVRKLQQPFNMGKGAAVRAGVAEATAPFVIIQDADLEYDPGDYELLAEPLVDDRADVVFGSRFQTARPRRVLRFWHSMANRFLTALSNAFTNLHLTDMETCYKAFKREVIQAIEIEEDRFGLEPELTAKVAAGGWRIYEVGISYEGRTAHDGKKIGWKDGVRAIYCIVRYSPQISRQVRRLEASTAPAALPEQALPEQAGIAPGTEKVTTDSWLAEPLEKYLGVSVLQIGATHTSLAVQLADRHGVTVRRASDLERPIERRPVEGFDSIIVIDALERAEDEASLLADARPHLKSGGTLIALAAAHPHLFNTEDRELGRLRRYKKNELGRIVAAAGFRVIEVGYVDPMGASLAAAERAFGRRIPMPSALAAAAPAVASRISRPGFGGTAMVIAIKSEEGPE